MELNIFFLSDLYNCKFLNENQYIQKMSIIRAINEGV